MEWWPMSSPDEQKPDQTPAHPDPSGPRRAAEPPAPGELDALRVRIDEIDHRLIAMLNERASVVARVGEVKRATGAPIYAPHREAEVLKRVIAMNKGPLSDRAIEGVYRELMSGSFAIEQPLRIGYLGPPGSFSHQAAVTHFGASVAYEDLHAIDGVFTEVARGHVDYGLVPIENSTMGGIAETLDAFRDGAGQVNVYAEVLITIRHHLLANCEPSQVQRIHSKPEVFPQCRKWLATQYPQAELVPAASTSRAVMTARDEHEADPASGSAAIASSLAGNLYGVRTIFEDIEDNPNNITRFFVIARQEAGRTGDDKTSIHFQTEDKPGALARVLIEFDLARVNLTHIDKRPSGRENWRYSFFVDAEGHREDDRVVRAIEGAREHCASLTVLGSYPRARRIL
jgi:chorismate mutase/prephenate dehydratase